MLKIAEEHPRHWRDLMPEVEPFQRRIICQIPGIISSTEPAMRSRSFTLGGYFSAPALVPIVSAISAMAIFSADVFISLGVAIATLYAFVVFISSSFLDEKGVVYVAATCITLTLAAFFWEHGHVYSNGPIIRCLFSICVILLTAFLTVRNMRTNILVRERDRNLLQAQSELSHMARVTTLGELTSSIAHEVNQPLAALVSNGEACLRWLGRDKPDIEAATASVAAMVSNARRASDVVARLRAMAKKSAGERHPVDVNALIDDVLLVIALELSRNNIEVVKRLESAPCVVIGDRVQLQQVILNLAMNAMQAMLTLSDQPRILTISTRNVVGCKGACVEIDVADVGPGVGESDANMIFDAFFTTKSGGLGMGLAICRSVVEAHRGSVLALPGPGPGALFRVTLPANASMEVPRQ